ncbi:nuclease domain-containing protein [Sphingobacterium sp. JUb56]|uniref:nuclease domain-containing protein n=1 Tax=Sphingobacterium sp. JUb56 TaxID=2587145 RepID=UPI00161024BB|nr:nuclease domain-containing protein [Sphingobacterium sp. JUb56]MBB2951149.1 hypothetical protein [Sphingobacterium sp. JUb56]
MFKIFEYIGNSRIEIIPIDGIYTVHELKEYIFYYTEYSDSSIQEIVFLEDSPIDFKHYKIVENQLSSSKQAFFQDYFGFAALKVNNQIFKFNIQIDKLKLAELENLMLFLWEHQNEIFFNFLGKSTVKANNDKFGSEFSLTSKFLNTAYNFYETLKKLFIQFQKYPQSSMGNYLCEVEYSPEKVSSHTISWLLKNLDRIQIDSNSSNHPNAIPLLSQTAFLDKIETIDYYTSYKIYENEIILGAFINVLEKLSSLKRVILSNVNISVYEETKYADFKDLKKIPFLKLYEEAEILQKRINRLFEKYKNIFPNVKPRNEKPKLTPVFAKRRHYLVVFKLINTFRVMKFNLDAELQLLNIRKLSQLYEAYNLHSLVQLINHNINFDLFQISKFSNRSDGIIDKVLYLSESTKIQILYEPKYYGQNRNDIDLIRIDSRKGTHYNPDYVIEIINNDCKSYYILDSKYTKFETIKRYVNESTFKYILNTGVYNYPNRKIDGMILLYPGNIDELIIESNNFGPQISIIASKPKHQIGLSSFIKKMISIKIPLDKQSLNLSEQVEIEIVDTPEYSAITG